MLIVLVVAPAGVEAVSTATTPIAATAIKIFLRMHMTNLNCVDCGDEGRKGFRTAVPW